MKIKSLLITLVLAFICLSGIDAQETQTKYYFFDSDWKITTSKDYTFYRKVEVYKNGSYANPIVDYYRNGQIQCIVRSDAFNLTSGANFLDAGGKNGDIAFYNKSEELVAYRRYVNGKLVEERKPQVQEDWLSAQNVQAGLEMVYTAYQLYRLVKGK